MDPKTAAKWLGEYDSLEEIMANADSVKGKIGENLRASLELLPMSYELATIKTDVQLGCSVESLEAGEEDEEGLRRIFTELEFKPWVEELSGSDSLAEAAADVPVDYDLVLTTGELDGWIETLSAAPAFAFDTETTSIDYMEAALVGVSFCCQAGKAALRTGGA